MKWLSESRQNPGYSVYYANSERDPEILYVIRQKRKTKDFTPPGWRVFVRPAKTQPLKTIHLGATLKECKDYVEAWEAAMIEAGS